jgi:hypothetical protein
MLCVDFLAHLGRDFFVFDVDSPDGGLITFFQDNVKLIDFARTDGKMELFDTMLSAPSQDYIIDLPYHQLDLFFSQLEEIGFVSAAHQANLEVVVFFVHDMSGASISRALTIRKQYPVSQFIPVSSDTVEAPFDDPKVARAYADLRLDGEISLPKLSNKAILSITDDIYSFDAFLNDETPDIPEDLAHELFDFYKTVYLQLDRQQLKFNIAALRKTGIA